MKALSSALADVSEFHAFFATTPPPTEPTLQTEFQTKRRAKWVKEEMDELLEATTIADQADAYIDGIYFAMGGLLELGIDPDPIWDIVHDANMAKRQPDGTVLRDPANNNKVVKPSGWQDPTPLIKAEVDRQIEEAQVRGLMAQSKLPEHVVRKVVEEAQ